MIRAPTLIIHLPLDQVNGPRLTIPLEKGIPNARGAVLEGAAHVVAGKALRNRYFDILLGFLDDIDAREAGVTK
jgi:hypothetical protein